MSKRIAFILTVVLAVAGEAAPEPSLPPDNSVVNANSQFSLDLYAEFKKETGNIFFSPGSISTALAMVYEGARGKTAEEMQSVCHFPTDGDSRRTSFALVHDRLNKPNSKYKLSIANALWVQDGYTLLDEYVAVVRKYYAGEAANVDFGNPVETARQTINRWVEDKTHDKIRDLFPEGSLAGETSLVLTSTIYFKGIWVRQFERSQTKDEDFRVSTARTVRVPMMRRTDEGAKFNYTETSDLQVLEMPYEGDGLSMLVFLPKSDDLSPLENSLSSEKINEWRGKLWERRVDVFMPKLAFNAKYSMNGTLAKMGMPTAFTEDADFSGMNGKKELYIQVVIHQAFVDVNEEGTEATAATGLSMGTTSAMPLQPTPVFRADHPFIFLIQDKENGNILFFGRVSNPSA